MTKKKKIVKKTDNNLAKKKNKEENNLKKQALLFWTKIKKIANYQCKNQVSFSLLLIFAIAIISALLYLYYQKTFANDVDYGIHYSAKKTVKEEKTCLAQHNLTGECLLYSNEKDKKITDLENLKVYAVMVENHLDARPQSAISEAILAYEALVEGGITRYLLVFDNSKELLEKVKAIGPVRSARPYYLPFAIELNNATYAHVGGSPEALEKINAYAMNNCDEFANGHLFYRDKRRYAPHNAYISLENLVKCDKLDSGYLKDIESWQYYSDDEVNNFNLLAKKVIGKIDINFSKNPVYGVEWQYNFLDKSYYRFYMNGQPQLDALNNKQVKVANVLVLEMPSKVIDDYGRLKINVIGEGKGVLYNLGQKFDVIWKKASNDDRLKIYDLEGKEVKFKVGKTWVEIVNSLNNIENGEEKEEK